MRADQVRQGFTNQVLKIDKSDSDKGKDIYFVPCYLRMKLKNITELNLQSLKAQINTTLIFTVYYGNLSQKIVSTLQNQIVFHFDRDDALKLSPKTKNLELKMKDDIKKKCFTYTIRRLMKTRIQCDVFLSPFEVVNLILSITIQSVSVEGADIKFNMMNFSDRFLKISYSQQGRFGNYDLAEALMRVEYSNHRIPFELREQIAKAKKERDSLRFRPQKKKKAIYQKPKDSEDFTTFLLSSFQENIQGLKNSVREFFSPLEINEDLSDYMMSSELKVDNELKHFQYAHFTLPLYRMPQSTIATIFMPLLLLGIINLGIFFQDKNLANRIASLATLMIAFVSLIATIRQTIPPSPSITFVQILVYLQTFTTILGFIHSLSIRNMKKEFNLKWQTDTLFLISLFITVFTFVSITVLYLRHRYIREPSYNRFEDEEAEIKFDRKIWNNKYCDRYFMQVPEIHQLLK